MVESLTYRTADNTRWGGGFGSDLSAVLIDLNFWILFSAIQALEDHQETSAGIDYMVLTGNQLFVHLTDHRVLGPLTVPTAQWRPRGAWQADISYSPFDTFSYNGTLYIVNIAHTSGSTFSALSTDGLGHDLYTLLLEQPEDALPEGGTLHQRLVKSSESPFQTEWLSDRVRLAVTVSGQPDPGEVVMSYCVVDDMQFPLGLDGSVAFEGTPTGSDVSWTILKNGAAIGSVDFSGPSPQTISNTFPSAIDCESGDIISLAAPDVPDADQADVSITLVANLT